MTSDERGGLRAALVLADGVLGFVLVVAFVGTVLPSRPLDLPTGASGMGVVVLGIFGFACGVVLGERPHLVERCSGTLRARTVDALLLVGTLLVASLVVLPAFGVDLSVQALVLGVVGVALVSVAPVVALGGDNGDEDGDSGLFFRRALAAVVDGVPTFALWYATVWILLPTIGRRTPAGATWGEVAGVVVVLFVWSTLVRLPFEAYNGRSLGKLLAGVRVVDEDGNTPSVGAAVVRNALRPIDSLPFGYLVGLSYAAGTEGRRIGDIAAGTRVVRKKN